ncbi:response regulator transcription factor [Actinomadura barringtoniae]|uniref:Response regulator transcription factor n=1 Tax=Actinomadura barringtoniae TaxID=1427535 RepID=A0A939T8J5_9ACTN|nr:response regulator transcription factor [Actinomadura barringtoniae]MBO2453204.1 response regulator transcription factor [Actinomadura barringtoniae]
MISVLVADDQALVRAGLVGIIGTAPDLEAVGEAADGAQAVALARELQPDVVIMDIRMPGVDGLEATRQITGSRVLVLTTFDLDQYVYAALRGGASGFLLKDTPPRELLDGIRTIARGDALLSPAITRRLITAFTTRPIPPDSAALANLTARERDVLLLVAEGLSNAEIAVHLDIAPGTARTHVAALLSKLKARDRIQLVILAHRSGLGQPLSGQRKEPVWPRE